MKKKSVSAVVKLVKTPGVFNVTAEKDGTLVLKRTGLNKENALLLYFNNIEDNIKNTTYTAEEIYEKYKEKWNKIKFKSEYIDTYGHKWKNTFVSDKKILEYLNNLINKTRCN